MRGAANGGGPKPQEAARLRRREAEKIGPGGRLTTGDTRTMRVPARHEVSRRIDEAHSATP